MAKGQKEPQELNLQSEESLDAIDIEGDEADAVSDSEDPDAKPKRRAPRRRRAPVKAKAEDTAQDSEAPTEESPTEEAEVAVDSIPEQAPAQAVSEAEAKEPTRRRTPRKKPVAPEAPSEIPAQSAPGAVCPLPSEIALTESVDHAVKQWAAAKEVSVSLVGNLERVATILAEMQNNYVATMQEMAKPKYAKFTLVNRISAAVSAVALLIAFISLALSQSARQSAVDAMALSKVVPGTLFSAQAARSESPASRSKESPDPDFLASRNAPAESNALAKREGNANLTRSIKRRK